MVKKCFVSLAVAAAVGLGAGQAHAGLVVSTSPTATDLVNALLSGNSGIVVSNATLVGLSTQSGTFTGGNSASLGFDSGIMLTSGDATQVPLAVAGGDAGMSVDQGQAGDVKLDGIVGGTFDASVLTFDFVPTGDTVQFSYVFASTEYNDFVNTQFNDVFAFFVNDVNYALVPGTTTPVSINTVNCGQAQTTTPGVNPTNCDQFRDNRLASGNVGATALVNHGGLTNVFSFIAPVNPNVTNTMYLAIADRFDGVLDSSVFIEAGSFSVCGGPNQPPCGGTVPEPASVTLLGLALAGLGLARRRQR